LLALSLVCLATAAAAMEQASRPPLRITEIMASNGVTLEDACGRNPDWIELHNEGAEPISLEGFALSDKKDKLEKYVFPAGAVIQPGEYIIVFASGAKKDIADEYHASFKLSASGEAVYLSKGGIMVDSVLFGPQEKDISLALDADGEYRKTLTPTPGAANLITPVANE
jgi:hypothetical protein